MSGFTAPESLPLVPFVDLSWQQAELAVEIQQGLANVIARNEFVLGPEVAAFETEFAEFQEVKHCVGVANGTDALELMLRAGGLGPGMEVIVPANTFIATPLAVLRAGAHPVLTDVDPDTLLMTTQGAAAVLTPRTAAILPVHLYGQLAGVDELGDWAEQHGVAIFEDGAQSHGARHNGNGMATVGTAAATSFYPSKNLGAYGDAGAVLTNSAEFAARVRALGNYGSQIKYEHPTIGFNSRLDTMQAVVLRAKLSRLAAWTLERRAAAERYTNLLRDFNAITLPSTAPGNDHVWHLYVIQIADRDRVLGILKSAGIGAAVHYPKPVHLHGAFRYLGHGRGSFPISEQASERVLSLPLFPGISISQQERVAEALTAALK